MVTAKMSTTGAGWNTYCEEDRVIQELMTAGQLTEGCCKTNPSGQILNLFYTHKPEIMALAEPYLAMVIDPRETAWERYKGLRASEAGKGKEPAQLLDMMLLGWSNEYKAKHMIYKKGWVAIVTRNKVTAEKAREKKSKKT